MDITKYILSRYQAVRKNGRPRYLVGICGRAGAGKSTLAEALCGELRDADIQAVTYAGDWRFLLDSRSRKNWLAEQSRQGLNPYLYSINQFSWWDFRRIHEDLKTLLKGSPLRIENAYDRRSGKRDLSTGLPAVPEGVVVFENAILGGVDCLQILDAIVVVNTPDNVCFERTFRRDAGRRTLSEIATRFLITTYSENLFLETLDRFPERTISCDDKGALGRFPELQQVTHLPIPLSALRKPAEFLSATPILEPKR